MAGLRSDPRTRSRSCWRGKFLHRAASGPASCFVQPKPFPHAVSTRPHILILGAGLMGRLLALALARQGHRVEMHDAGPPDASSAAARAAAAMLAPLA